MTLSRLTLRNFRKWKKLVLELSSTVTVLVGPTDCGKSATLGALKWLCLNSPDGDSFIRHGAKSATVTLEFADHSISRRRGGGKNSYTLDGKDYVSFGRGKVPDDIAALLNISPLSFQTQHSAPYWLSLSAGEVSRELNSIVNLDLIDRSLANAASAVRSCQATLAVCEERFETATAKLGKLGWVAKARKEWDVLEGLRMDADKARARATLGAKLLASVAEAARGVDRLSNGILCGKKAIAAWEAAYNQRQRLAQLNNLVDKLGKLSSTSKPPDPTQLNALLELAKQCSQQRQRLANLKKLVGELDRLEREGEAVRLKADKIKAGIDKQLKTKGCPACGHLGAEQCRSH